MNPRGAMTVTRSTIDHVTVPLRGLRALRVAVRRLPSGEAESASLALGWVDPWRPEISIDLPASVLPDVVAALQTLADGR